MSKSKLTLVEAGMTNTGAFSNPDCRRALSLFPVRDYATRSNRLELCWMETRVALVGSRRAVDRILGLIASLKRARRNITMKKTAAPQKLANANDPITLETEQGKVQNRKKGN
jgi:hypothetical protein